VTIDGQRPADVAQEFGMSVGAVYTEYSPIYVANWRGWIKSASMLVSRGKRLSKIFL
jgi:hypothetical protein